MKIAMALIAAMATVVTVMNAQAEVTVKDAWVRAAVQQQKATGAFLQIQSSADARLVEVQTSIASMTEIHEMKMDNNVMRMRELSYLDLPAGKLVELKPGSFHLMLMGVKTQIKSGDVIALTLIVENKDKKREVIEVKAKARALNSADGKM